MSALPANAVERFRIDLYTVSLRAVNGTLSGGGPSIALAVSGGPDSMAMLALAAEACPGQIIAATFDHQLREGSAEEASMVAAACATLDVPHATLTPCEPIAGSSLQMRAREARYQALTQWAQSADAYPLLTAHHADDQAETLLMRLNRASGVSGLSGIRPYSFAGGTMILRPLLAWRRTELRAIVEQASLPFIDDPSNEDDRHDRSRIRTFLRDHPELNAVSLAASASYLVEAEEVLSRLAERSWSELWNGRTDSIDLDDLPRELRRRLVRKAIIEVRTRAGIVLPPFSDASNVEAMLDAIETRHGAVQGGVQARWMNDAWHFRPAPPRRSR